MTQYVILPSIVTEEMIDAHRQVGIGHFPPAELAQADLDAFISAAPDSGMVACATDDIRKAILAVELAIDLCDKYPVPAALKVECTSVRNRLSSALEAK